MKLGLFLQNTRVFLKYACIFVTGLVLANRGLTEYDVILGLRVPPRGPTNSNQGIKPAD